MKKLTINDHSSLLYEELKESKKLYVSIREDSFGRSYINNKSFYVYDYIFYYPTCDVGVDIETDKNGYYARSTDEEVIRFIKMFKKRIDVHGKFNRKEKLKRIIDGTNM